MYFIAGVDKEGKAIHRFDFVVDDSYKFSLTSDFENLQTGLKSVGSKENEDFFGYTRFYLNKNKEFGELMPKTKGMNKADSAKFMQEKAKLFTEEVIKFESDFFESPTRNFFRCLVKFKN